ncbi:MAG: UDP-N-acetylmuramoyl-tripeptide--D-alanyl-D-alanine ligase [bacterium]|nr:UDP-N-acetylmuramoyl-tripeptide--D-alanyl-D-alanine ligase [bacterium]
MAKYILQTLLAILAKLTIWRFNPKVIGITGSVGKTSTRETVFAVLKTKYRVRQAEKNYNNEIGLPLTILNIPHYGKNFLAWGWGFVLSAFSLIKSKNSYPEILILEYGVDKPGDMDFLLNLAKPDIAVITAIGETPMHVENFKDPEGVISEKVKLIKCLGEDGYAILNHDDYVVYDIKNRTKGKVLTYGFEENAEVKAINYILKTTLDETLGEMPEGASFKINFKNKIIPVRMHGVLGKSNIYAALAAAAVGTVLDINLIKVSEALADLTPPAGRLRLLMGIKNSLILDDTYNAGPESTRLALETLKDAPGKRKIVILGDMLELGKYTEAAHRSIGDQAAEFADILVTVGVRAKFISDEANLKGLDKSQIFIFDSTDSARGFLDQLIKEGDLILVKGSQGMRMEKIVEEIMLNPERAKELLVRQEEYWFH